MDKLEEAIEAAVAASERRIRAQVQLEVLEAAIWDMEQDAARTLNEAINLAKEGAQGSASDDA